MPSTPKMSAEYAYAQCIVTLEYAIMDHQVVDNLLFMFVWIDGISIRLPENKFIRQLCYNAYSLPQREWRIAFNQAIPSIRDTSSFDIGYTNPNGWCQVDFTPVGTLSNFDCNIAAIARPNQGYGHNYSFWKRPPFRWLQNDGNIFLQQS